MLRSKWDARRIMSATPHLRQCQVPSTRRLYPCLCPHMNDSASASTGMSIYSRKSHQAEPFACIIAAAQQVSKPCEAICSLILGREQTSSAVSVGAVRPEGLSTVPAASIAGRRRSQQEGSASPARAVRAPQRAAAGTGARPQRLSAGCHSCSADSAPGGHHAHPGARSLSGLRRA